MSKQELDLNFSVLEGKTKTVPSGIELKSKKDYISWGEDNEFPNYLYDLYLRCSLEQTIINGIKDYVLGEGVMNVNPVIKSDKINEDDETLDDILSDITLDLVLYGGFAIQVLFNYDFEISELYHVDLRHVRVDQYDKYAYVSDSWGWGSKPSKIDIFDRKLIKASEQSDEPIYTALFYFKDNSRSHYPVPMYNGSIKSFETECEIQNFHLNNILNNLESSAIITFLNGEPTKEEMKKLEQKIDKKLKGTSNAGRYIINYASDEAHSVKVDRLQEDHLDEKFQTLSKDTMRDIFVAFRAQPVLFGINPDNNGFSRTEYDEVFQLYNKTMIVPIQNKIIRCFNKIYGVDNSFEFKEFKLDVNKVEE